jgi:hypothetical protein
VSGSIAVVNYSRMLLKPVSDVRDWKPALARHTPTDEA